MRIRKEQLYVADIMVCTDYYKSEEFLGGGVSIGGVNYNGKLDTNGERELLIKISDDSAWRVAVKDIKSDLHYLAILAMNNGILSIPQPGDKRRVFIEPSPVAIGSKYYKNIKQLFPGDKKKLDLVNLKDLRYKVKYTKKYDVEQIEDEKQLQIDDSDEKF